MSEPDERDPDSAELIDQIESNEPIDRTEPIDQIAQVYPSELTDPIDPVDPVDPADPAMFTGELPFGDSAPDPQLVIERLVHLQSIVESLLFAADKALTLQQLGELLGERDLGLIRQAVARIETAQESRGFQLHQVAGGYQFRTNPQHAVWVQKLLAQKPVRLTRSQLETLAICAYRQPITRPEIDEIRGVDSGGTLKTLMDRQLVRILGKKEEPGRPMLYGTTREFLEFFNLSDLKGLPSLREFHELSDEHRAQVEALEAAAPEGTIEAPLPEAPLHPPLPRVELSNAPEDTAELEEIDRLIERAGSGAQSGMSEPPRASSSSASSSDDEDVRPEPTEEL